MRLNGVEYNDQSLGAYTEEPIGVYTAKAFFWMFLGLLTTFAVAFFGYATGTILYVFAIPYFHIVLLVVELGVVLFLSARLHTLQVGTARALFFVYAAVNGVVFSAYFLIFSMLSLILVFAMTAVYFGAMALYGYRTKTDLTRLRPILVGGLIFLIVCGLLSLFLPLGMMDRVVCLIGIAIFLGFTAYDTQKIRALYDAYQGDQAMLERASIYSALQLYLDFINLFLYLLRFLGKKK
ncbi:Bax inhibitor-1/YccA family protein [uncultured Oscillibacter sp.]|uniref:Bax inhibitor-1/YccA family protein n=1 Tax=uncultured Oscillibacter sp. TaxID=876091 RepID=UPI0025D5B727|nr:Bax inhibitor-1/YccA family protein [uncultured Oscillibacter sp.]